MNTPRVIDLQEFVSRLLAPETLPAATGELLWRRYHKHVAVDFPSPKTDGQWRLTAQGWVGHLPLTDDLSIALHPKVPILNIFRMLEYAYELKSFEFLDGITRYQSIEEVYERLAHVLARRVLNRLRKGLYRAYVPRSERLPFVRERMDVAHALRKPWAVHPHCHYHEHTADVEDNQLLAWTLRLLARTGLQRADVRRAVRQAGRSLRGATSAPPFSATDCVGRRYSRLNEDYRPMHALCRFFLDHTGPSLHHGDRQMMPFLVDMAQLYESFVAAWLSRHLPPSLRLHTQDRVTFENNSYFSIDLTLYEASHDGTPGAARFILDTKYKNPSHPDTNDVAQVIAYAVAKNCTQAVLVYPRPLARPMNEQVGPVFVRSLPFRIDGDMEHAGDAFLQAVLQADPAS